MLLLAIPAIFSLGILATGYQMVAHTTTSGGHEVERIAHEVAMYRQFVFAAHQYMMSPAAPTLPGVVTWQQIRAAPTTPPGMAGLEMPTGWKIVKGATDWVACGQVAPMAATAMLQLLPSDEVSGQFAKAKIIHPDVGSAPGKSGYVVFTKEDLSAAKALSVLCN